MIENLGLSVSGFHVGSPQFKGLPVMCFGHLQEEQANERRPFLI